LKVVGFGASEEAERAEISGKETERMEKAEMEAEAKRKLTDCAQKGRSQAY
jgi:hypothetical protein